MADARALKYAAHVPVSRAYHCLVRPDVIRTGVAFRSLSQARHSGARPINFLAPRRAPVSFAPPLDAQVVELVDTQVSEACA